MKNKLISIIIALTAFALSSVAAYYSIFGLSKLFSKAAEAVIIMAVILEISKIILTGTLHIYASKLTNTLKIYLYVASTILIFITSMGIYGFLSDAYSQTKFKDDIEQRQIDLIKTKKTIFDEKIVTLKDEKNKIVNDISELRNGMVTINQTQTIDKRTGQILTNTTSGNKSLINKQLNETSLRRDKIDFELNILQDSSAKYEINILNIESKSEVSSELGPLKYISKITSIPMDSVVNYFLILLIIVFDPLALSMLIYSINIFNIKDEPKKEIKNVNIPIEEIPFPENEPIFPQNEELFLTDIEDIEVLPIEEEIIITEPEKIIKPKRGRPIGSKNKPKVMEINLKSIEEEQLTKDENEENIIEKDKVKEYLATQPIKSKKTPSPMEVKMAPHQQIKK